MKKQIFRTFTLLCAIALGSLCSSYANTYCNYTCNEFKKDGAFVTLTWTTAANGDVVIYIGKGEGAQTAEFRNGGFEGGLDEGFSVLSGDGFAIVEPASTYFTRNGDGVSNDKLVFTLNKKADVDLPNPCQIKFTEKAFSWTVNGSGPYCRPTLIYDYNSSACEQLPAPTSVSVDEDSIITFINSEGASYYVANVYKGQILKHTQEVSSGDKLTFFPLATADYDVRVQACGYDILNSEESDAYVWSLEKREIVLPGSEYCGMTMGKDKNVAQFTWVTLANGNIEITLAEPDGTVDAEKTTFRKSGSNPGMDISKLFVGAAKGDVFFIPSYSKNVLTLALKDPDNAPDLGGKISYNGSVYYKVVANQNAYPTLQFNYTYGSTCASLTAPTNVILAQDGTITFDAVDGAESYLVRVYDGSAKKLECPITSGDKVPFYSFKNATYQVCVVAVAGTAKSDESATKDWTLTPSFVSAQSEYCERLLTTKNDHNIVFDWQTNEEGSVVITISEGDGGEPGTTYFREDGMCNDKLERFTIGEGKQLASNYFERVYTTGGQVYTLRLKEGVSLAPGTKIYHAGNVVYTTHISGNVYDNFGFEYTYGAKCPILTPPANVAIAQDGTITFDAVDGAESYLVRVYDGSTKKLECPIASGEKVAFYSFKNATYQVCVVAVLGAVKSKESDKIDWTLSSSFVSAQSEYCERIVTSGTNSVVFDWQTNEEGSVVITISEGDGGESGTTYFRQDGMSNQALSKFTVGESKQPAGNYFERVYTTGGQVYTLQLKENVQLAPGTKIYQSGNVEYVSQSEGDNAYHDFGFEYTYGTRCIGIQVSADVNDATMGSAVVKQNGEEISVVEEGAVQFIATPTNEHYQFVNWTQNGVEVSPAATYEMTPTATTRLVANFIYVRYVYCHTPIYDDNNAKSIYLTLGTTGKENEYEIKFEGTPSYHLTGVNDANFAGRDGSGVTNNTETDPVVEPNVLNKPKWNVDTETDYGVISIKFTAEDYTKIDFSSHYLPMATSNGEFIMDKNFPIGYAVDWTNSCVDVEAPVLDNPSAEALNSTDVRLTLKATDNRDGVLTYTISRADMEDIIIKRASGETVTQDILGLPSPATYEFSVVVSDGAGNTCEAKTCSVTLSASDTEAPTNVLVVATPVSDQIVELTLSADDNYDGDITYVISYGEGGSASTSAERGTTTTYQITGLTANTEYTFSVVASDAAGNEAAAVSTSATTFSGNLALNKVSIAGDAEGVHTADKANDGDVKTYWGTYGTDHATANVWTVNLGMVYDIKSVIMTTNNMQGGTRSIMVMGSIDGNTWSEVVAARDYTEKMTGFATGLEDKQARYLRVVGPTNGMISISEFEAYGTLAVDTEDPVITSFTADGVSATSVIVKATATDNFLGDLTYQFHCEGMTDPNTITEVAGTEVNYIFEGLTTGVEYKFTVTVTDQRGNSVTSDQIITTPIADDETAPSIPEVSNVVALFNTVSFTVVSTDDKGGNITYVVKDGDTQVATTSALSATPVQITIDNLIPNTTYTLTITASDASDNTSEVADVLFTTEGPAPSSSVRTAGMVRAIYTDAYDVNHYLAHDFVKVNFGGASYTEETIDGDKHMRYYPAASGQDIVWGSNNNGDNAIIAIDKYNDGTNKGLDVRNMEYLHVDIWSKTAINFDIKLNDKTIGYANHTGSGWEQFDLPLMEVAEESKTNVRWMKFNNGKNLVCLDNVYFYTTTPVIVDQMDIADPAPIWMAFDGEAMDVTLNRAFEADGFNYTLCLPFDLPEDQMQEAFGADYKLWKLDDAYMKSAEVLYLDFKEVRDLEAGVPYIFLPTQNFIAGGTFSGVTIKNELYPVEFNVDAFGSVSMTGIYSPYTLPVENNYVLGDDNWLYQSDGTQMKGLRCYFTLTPPSAPAGVRARAVFHNTDVVTDLEPIDGAQCTMHDGKYIIDGRFVIIRNNARYNGIGQQVK